MRYEGRLHYPDLDGLDLSKGCRRGGGAERDRGSGGHEGRQAIGHAGAVERRGPENAGEGAGGAAAVVGSGEGAG